jgi:5-bromo-4-chloroindolyl phosphate hydrolysis protein
MNAAEAQLEVASHLAEARQQLAQAVLACRDYLYLAKIRQQLELLEQEMVRLNETV